jgi:hypothetical protein
MTCSILFISEYINTDYSDEKTQEYKTGFYLPKLVLEF